MTKLKAYIKLLRPINLFTGAFAVWVSSQIVLQPVPMNLLILAMAVVLLYNAGANAINDYWDYETDLVNRPERPLSTGIISRKAAIRVGVALFLIGTILAVFLPLTAALIAIVVAMPLMFLYTPIFKGRPLAGNFIVAFILGLTFLFAGASFHDISTLVIPAALAFGLTLVRELVKDMADLEGDRKIELRTFPIVAGMQKAGRLAAVLSILVILESLWPFAIHVYSWVYGAVLIPGIILPLLYVIYKMMRNPTSDESASIAGLLKFCTLAGVAAIWLGSIY